MMYKYRAIHWRNSNRLIKDTFDICRSLIQFRRFFQKNEPIVNNNDVLSMGYDATLKGLVSGPLAACRSLDSEVRS